MGASALAGEAAIYEIKEDYARAGDRYRAAALQFESDLTSPDYLIAAGRVYEKAAQYAAAGDAYQMILDRFPEATQVQEVDFHLARVRSKMR